MYNKTIGGLQMIKIGKFAKEIGVTVQTLRNWDNNGTLTPFKVINGVRYYSEAQLKQFIDNGDENMVE